MAIPKTFTTGERLLASDLNDNFEYLEIAVDQAGPDFATSSSDTILINFSKDRIIARAAAGDISFTASNYTAGKSASVRVVAGSANRSLSFPSEWKFVSFKPTTLTSGSTGILTVTLFGSSAADAVAAWASED